MGEGGKWKRIGVYQRIFTSLAVVGDNEARVWNNVRFEREAKKADRFE